MPLNSTDAERQQTANRQLAEKLKLERPMQVQLKSLFSTIGMDLEAFFDRTGQVPDASVYSTELSGILARQYRRTNAAFSNNITDFLKEADEDDPTVIILLAFAQTSGMTLDELIANMENEALVRTQEFTVSNIAEDNKNITSTTQKDLDTAIVFGTLLLADQGNLNPTRAQVSKAARKSFLKSSRSRPKTIATTVTQKGSEGVKQIENDVFFENRNRGFGVPLQKKEFWITRGDEKVRVAHVAADNTTKNANGVFIVDGEMLRFPGDTSLGASPGNVINCRCVSVLEIDDSKTPLITFVN